MNAHTVMIAAPAYAFEVIAEALAPLSAGLICAESYDEALRRFGESHPDVVIVGYFFDEIHPYRLVEWLAEERRKRRRRFSIIMARALPMQVAPLNAREVEITYRAMGADEVFSIEAHSAGLGGLRELVQGSLG
jgi:hypothetical protein